jgi:peptidoglycan-associated lipoprotein
MKLMTTLALSAIALTCAACGGNQEVPPPKQPVVAMTTSAPPQKAEQAAPPPANPNSAVNVDDEIRRVCNLVEKTDMKSQPKFDYDSADLSPEERDVLTQIAKCLTTGPLKGRSVQLIGRADPRGETEYNMTLGGRRAHSVDLYMAGLGVDKAKMSETSRGELDASGKDEEGWKKDRRVDVRLAR